MSNESQKITEFIPMTQPNPDESQELEAEIERLHEFIMRVAERLAAASEVLGQVAERKRK